MHVEMDDENFNAESFIERLKNKFIFLYHAHRTCTTTIDGNYLLTARDSCRLNEKHRTLKTVRMLEVSKFHQKASLKLKNVTSNYLPISTYMTKPLTHKQYRYQLIESDINYMVTLTTLTVKHN